MLTIKNIFSSFFIISTLLISTSAYSCKFVRPDFSKYMNGEISKAVIFVGKAVALKETSGQHGESRLDVTFQVKKEYIGKVENKVLVIGSKGSMKGTSCEGEFDLRAAVGQNWVIVGETDKNSSISPNVHLSRKLTEEKIPDSLKDLKKLISE